MTHLPNPRLELAERIVHRNEGDDSVYSRAMREPSYEEMSLLYSIVPLELMQAQILDWEQLSR